MIRAVVKGGLQEQNKVHFLLDEAASLGHLECLDDALDKGRAYSLRLHYFFQSMGQLKTCFPDGQDQTLLSNVSQVFFGVNDPTTAEYVSNRLGESTIIIDSGGTSVSSTRQSSNKGDSSYGSSSTVSKNWAQHGRKLLKPEEVLGLSDRIAITFTPGVPPIQTRLVRYYEESFTAIEPSTRQRLLTAAQVLKDSLVIFLSAGLVAMFLSGKRLYDEPKPINPFHMSDPNQP